MYEVWLEAVFFWNKRYVIKFWRRHELKIQRVEDNKKNISLYMTLTVRHADILREISGALKLCGTSIKIAHNILKFYQFFQETSKTCSGCLTLKR